MRKQPVKKVAKTAPKKVAEPKRAPSDPNQFAFDLAHRTLEAMDASAPSAPSDSEISRVMSALGRRGGKVGGRARAEKLTADQRKEIASLAAQKRWAKRTESDTIQTGGGRVRPL